jgi:hypothetical protein
LVLPVNFLFFQQSHPAASASNFAGCLLAGSLVAQPHLMDLKPLPIDVPISSYLMLKAENCLKSYGFSSTKM